MPILLLPALGLHLLHSPVFLTHFHQYSFCFPGFPQFFIIIFICYSSVLRDYVISGILIRLRTARSWNVKGVFAMFTQFHFHFFLLSGFIEPARRPYVCVSFLC